MAAVSDDTGWSPSFVNMLGVGLHSYGFTDSAAFWLVVFGGSQLAVMMIGALPLDRWRSRDALSGASSSTVFRPSAHSAGG